MPATAAARAPVEGKASVIARCPYTDFLHVSQLLEDSKANCRRVCKQAGDLRRRFQARRRPPRVALYGELPGAFVHAMALDNLLTFGDGAKRPAPKNDWPLVAMALFVGFVPRSPLRQVNILDRWRVMRLVLFVIVLASLPALFWLASTPQAPVALICMALAYLLIRSFFRTLMLVIGVTSLGAAWVSYCLLNFGPVEHHLDDRDVRTRPPRSGGDRRLACKSLCARRRPRPGRSAPLGSRLRQSAAPAS